MDNAESLIRLYRTCFFVSLSVTVIAAALVVFLFLRFGIARRAKRCVEKTPIFTVTEYVVFVHTDEQIL